MVGSLQDQLLKLGLVTEEQVAEARTKPPRRAGEEQRGRDANKRGRRDASRRDGPRGKPGAARRDTAPREEPSAARQDGAAAGANEAPRPAGRRRRRGGAQDGRGRGGGSEGGQAAAAGATAGGRKAERGGTQTPAIDPAERALRDRVHGLITDRAESREQGETPYHFVKGSRIKRIYVTEAQRDRLASGELAVAAMKGRHYLVPMSVAEEIRGLIPAYFVAMGASHTPAGDGSDIDEEYAEFQVPDDLTW